MVTPTGSPTLTYTTFSLAHSPAPMRYLITWTPGPARAGVKGGAGLAVDGQGTASRTDLDDDRRILEAVDRIKTLDICGVRGQDKDTATTRAAVYGCRGDDMLPFTSLLGIEQAGIIVDNTGGIPPGRGWIGGQVEGCRLDADGVALDQRRSVDLNRQSVGTAIRGIDQMVKSRSGLPGAEVPVVIVVRILKGAGPGPDTPRGRALDRFPVQFEAVGFHAETQGVFQVDRRFADIDDPVIRTTVDCQGHLLVHAVTQHSRVI